MFMPLQAGSWLMSIMAALGAAPSNFTVPVTVAAVAGSIGVAAGAAAPGAAAGCSSVDSFFPHPARRMSPQRVGKARIAFQIFVFLGGQHRKLFRNVGEGLPRERLEEPYQFAQLIFGKRERGHADLQIRAHAVAIVIRVVQGRISQETQHPFGINPSTLGEKLWRQLLLSVGALIAGHGHERSALTGNELMAAHTVIFLDYPPAFLNVAAIIQWPVLIAGRKRVLMTAQKKSGERANLFPGQVQVRHSQLFGFGLVLALVPDVGFREFVLEEALLVIPGPLGGAFGQTR